MKTNRLASLAITAALVAAMGAASLDAAYIPGVSATTDMGSGFGTDIANTVNGAGLVTPGDLDSHHSPTTPSDSWVSSGTLTGTATFDFGASYTIGGFSFWNQNAGGPGSLGSTGIKDVAVSVSTDGLIFAPLAGAPIVFAQVMTSGGPPEKFTFSPVAARYVRFAIASNYGDPSQTGFAEVGFDGTLAPITTVVALKGDPVPGEPAGTIYNGFGTPSFDGDDVDFLAKIKGPGGSRKAIILGTPQAVVLRTGDSAPDAGVATFKLFKDPVFASGRYAVIAGITATDGSVTRDNDAGIWSAALGSLHLLAREGGTAPGTSGAVFTSFLSLALSTPPSIAAGITGNGITFGGDRGAVFVAKLVSGGADIVTSANDYGLWREMGFAPGVVGNVGFSVTSELLLREGQSINVGDIITPDMRTVKSFTCIKSVSGSPGHGRNLATNNALNARVFFTNGTQAILEFSATDPSFFVVLKTGDASSAGPDSPVFKKFGVPAFYSGSDGYTLLASLKTGVGGITTANDSGIFDFSTSFGVDGPAVSEGDLAVGAGANYFYKFKDPTTSAENIAFVASLKKNALTGVDSTNDYGLWKGFTDFGLTLVAREGSEGPGIPGSALKSFVSQALPDVNGGPLFTAKLVIGTGGVLPADAFALWANLGVGADETFLLARQGHPLDASGTTYGVRTITALKSVSGSPGHARAYNNAQGVTYKAKLDGGLEAIFRVQLPPPPEPPPTISARKGHGKH